MRRVERAGTPGPASLLTPGSPGPKELAGARKHFESGQGRAFPFGAYKGDDVRHTLEALFFGKCAYCEIRYDTNSPVDIEHFRPKGAVEGTDHPGYWWLAAEWTNLLPSCIDCNRRRYQPTPAAFASLRGGLEHARRTGFASIKTGKQSCFPLAESGIRCSAEPSPGMHEAAIAAEQCLLLDPCRDDPSEHLRYNIDRRSPLGIVYPSGSRHVVLPAAVDGANSVAEVERAARDAGVSVRGAVSIQVYGLNRLALVQERTRVLRKLEFLGRIVIEMSATADELEGLRIADEADEDVRKRAVKRLRSTAQRALAEIRNQSAPDAPFSEMVRAWIAVFRHDLAGAEVDGPRSDAPAPERPHPYPARARRRVDLT